jgi:hypothetical protein
LVLVASVSSSGIAISQSAGCTAEMSIKNCVMQIAEIARSFDDKLRAAYAEISKSELPVGSIITSVLPPDKFLNDKNPKFDSRRWVPADGRALPPNSIYQLISGQASAPDLRVVAQQKIVVDVISGNAASGQVVEQLRTPEFASAKWTMHFGLRDVQGNRANNDVEQDVDQFQVLVESGKLVARGRTLNWKHGSWGAWNETGKANYVGIATVDSGFYYYVKIN